MTPLLHELEDDEDEVFDPANQDLDLKGEAGRVVQILLEAYAPAALKATDADVHSIELRATLAANGAPDLLFIVRRNIEELRIRLSRKTPVPDAG